MTNLEMLLDGYAKRCSIWNTEPKTAESRILLERARRAILDYCAAPQHSLTPEQSKWLLAVLDGKAHMWDKSGGFYKSVFNALRSIASGSPE